MPASRRSQIIILALIAALSGAVWRLSTSQAQPQSMREAPDWREILEQRLPMFGQFNWIVVANADYPLAVNPGIETIVTGESHYGMVQYVLDALQRHRHVKPMIYTDEELKYMKDESVQGIVAYREKLLALLGARVVGSLPHLEVMNRLDEAAHRHAILVLKTDGTMPYATVFMQLDSGFWDEEAEKRIKAMMP